MASPDRPFDTALLNGFRFECRSDCGLCCYTTPAVSSAELARIRTTVGPVETLSLSNGQRVIASYGEGGACRLLAGRTCSAYRARPLPCSIFPVTVHGGPNRWQASLVLSCPGLSVDPLLVRAPRASPSSYEGIEAEVQSARERAAVPAIRSALDQDDRRRRARLRGYRERGRPLLVEEVRSSLRSQRIEVRGNDIPGELPPGREEGIQYLPLVWDGPQRVSAIESHPMGIRFRELSPDGQEGPPTDVEPIPRIVPPMTSEAEALLQGYLRYWLERDALFDYLLTVPPEDAEEETWIDTAQRELRLIGATVLTRGLARARRRGDHSRTMSAEAVALGIAATDMDLLDRPSLGVRL